MPFHRHLIHGAFAFLLGSACAAPLLAAQPPLSPLVEPVSQEHHVGKVVFLELVTPDLATAKKFYGGLFGWSFRDLQENGKYYAEASLDGRPVAALLQKDMPPGALRQPAWLSLFAVKDVDAAEAAAVKQGATMLSAPHSVPNLGRAAVLADPQGAIFAVLASSSGDPPDVLAEPGEWIWSTLLTRDPDTDAAFYQTLFDYEVFDLSANEDGQHLLLASDQYARASANMLPSAKSNVHPHWLNYVRVDDTDKMAAQVVALGGKVLVAPRADRHGGKLAVVADPMGAAFGLLEWPETESKEVSK